jgi:hypothetical protein
MCGRKEVAIKYFWVPGRKEKENLAPGGLLGLRTGGSVSRKSRLRNFCISRSNGSGMGEFCQKCVLPLIKHSENRMNQNLAERHLLTWAYT